jgi:hypothetical protein
MPEAVRLDNQVKAEEGMSQMVSVILKKSGSGGGGNGRNVSAVLAGSDQEGAGAVVWYESRWSVLNLSHVAPEHKRECCLLVLDSVTSTPHRIRQPKPRKKKEAVKGA